MSRRIKAILISGIVVLLATILIFPLIINNWSGLTGLAFTTIIFSEIVFFTGLLYIEWLSKNTQQLIIRSGLYIVLPIYSGLNILLSIMYIYFFRYAIKTFTVMQIMLLAAAIIASTVVIVSGKSVYLSNKETMQAVSDMESMIEKLNRLSSYPGDEQLSSNFRKISESLRFTDVSKIVPEDAEIDKVISSIEVEMNNADKDSHESINNFLVRLNTLISQRKISANAINKGEI